MGELRIGNNVYACRSFWVRGCDICIDGEYLRWNSGSDKMVQIQGEKVSIGDIEIPGVMFVSGEVNCLTANTIYSSEIRCRNIRTSRYRIISGIDYSSEHRKMLEGMRRRGVCPRRIMHITGVFNNIIVDGINSDFCESILSGKFGNVTTEMAFANGRAGVVSGRIMYKAIPSAALEV